MTQDPFSFHFSAHPSSRHSLQQALSVLKQTVASIRESNRMALSSGAEDDSGFYFDEAGSISSSVAEFFVGVDSDSPAVGE